MLGTSQKNWNPFLSPASACWGRAHIWGATWGTTYSTEEIQWPIWDQNTRFVSRKVLNYTQTKRLGSPAQRWGAATPINVVTIKRASFPPKQVLQSSRFIEEDYTASELCRELQTLSSFLPCIREQIEFSGESTEICLLRLTCACAVWSRDRLQDFNPKMKRWPHERNILTAIKPQPHTAATTGAEKEEEHAGEAEA